MTTQTKRTPGPEDARERIARQIYMGVWNDVIPRTAELSFERDPDPYFQIADNIISEIPFIVRLENAEAKVREALERPSPEMGEWLDLGPQSGCTPSLIPIATAHRIWRAYELKHAAPALLDGEGNGKV